MTRKDHPTATLAPQTFPFFKSCRDLQRMMAAWRRQSVEIASRIGAMPVPDRSVLSTLADIDEKLRAAETIIADVEFNLVSKIDFNLRDAERNETRSETPCKPPHRHTPPHRPPCHENALQGLAARFIRGIKRLWRHRKPAGPSPIPCDGVSARHRKS